MDIFKTQIGEEYYNQKPLYFSRNLYIITSYLYDKGLTGMYNYPLDNKCPARIVTK